jgi:hypothetical protein
MARAPHTDDKHPPAATDAPTYKWAFFGDPDLTDEQIDEIIRKRKPRTKPDTTGQPTSDADDSEA